MEIKQYHSLLNSKEKETATDRPRPTNRPTDRETARSAFHMHLLLPRPTAYPYEWGGQAGLYGPDIERILRGGLQLSYSTVIKSNGMENNYVSGS